MLPAKRQYTRANYGPGIYRDQTLSSSRDSISVSSQGFFSPVIAPVNIIINTAPATSNSCWPWKCCRK